MAHCDKYGIYVVDEAECRTPRNGQLCLFHRYPYHIQLIARNRLLPTPVTSIVCSIVTPRKTVLASLVGLSGNECGNGQVFHEQYRWLKANDKTRLVQLSKLGGEKIPTSCHIYPGEGACLCQSEQAYHPLCVSMLMHKVIAMVIYNL